MRTIQNFIEYLKKFNRDDCPSEFYKSWKILILGTNEYRCIYNSEFEILNEEYKRFKAGGLL